MCNLFSIPYIILVLIQKFDDTYCSTMAGNCLPRGVVVSKPIYTLKIIYSTKVVILLIQNVGHIFKKLLKAARSQAATRKNIQYIVMKILYI